MDLRELLGDTLIKGDTEISVDSLKGKVIGIYFSAHWCPPCRQFTPVLAKRYKTIQQSGKDFEIVFVSRDRDLEQFTEYFGTMPWCAIPFKDTERVQKLMSKFKVRGIPTFAVIDEDGNIISQNARGMVSESNYLSTFPWGEKTNSEAGREAGGEDPSKSGSEGGGKGRGKGGIFSRLRGWIGL